MKINKYQIIDHGLEHCQYFQGCGTAFTDYKDVFNGIGCSAHEALEDALDMAAQDGWETEHIENNLSKIITTDAENPLDDIYHHVSFRVK
jgi:hypothetical protein